MAQPLPRATRGLVWIAVGIAAFALTHLGGLHLVLRGTRVPVGLAIVGLGLVLLAWDLRRRPPAPGPDGSRPGERPSQDRSEA